jgi:hypothetical protein
MLRVPGIIEQASPTPLGREHRNRRTRCVREPIQQREDLENITRARSVVSRPAPENRLEPQEIRASRC